MNTFKFELGCRLYDKITGFAGIVYARTQWLHNCNVYGLKPENLTKDGKPGEVQYFDEPQLEFTKSQKGTMTPKQDTGGPTPRVRQTNR